TRIFNPRVGGSTPSLGTTFSFWWLQSYPKRHKKPAQCGFFVACRKVLVGRPSSWVAFGQQHSSRPG
ncbi:MAG: hypothetical protein OXF59_07465, partial [Pseudomonas sp.]|nr:hypothetical protein [Pseudomonas sp.]